MDHEHISVTATMVSLIRKDLTDIPHSHEIFQRIPRKSRSVLLDTSFNLLKWMVKVMPEKLSSIAYVEGRYKLLNDVINKNKNCVILEVAAGLSPRGMEYSDKGHMIIDTDLPDMNRVKQEIIESIYKEKGKKVPDDHYFLPVNVLNRDDMKRVGELYRKKGENRPLVMIHEGFLPYLTPDERIVFRDNVSWLFSKYAPGKGLWVTPDFSNFDFVDKKDLNPFIKLFFTAVQRVSKRKLYGFRDHDEVKEFLNEGELTGELYNGDQVIKNLYCVQNTKINVDKALEASQYYQLYMIKHKGKS